MQEDYLHYLWKTKRLPISSLQLVSKKSIHIIDFGAYNQHENGPDFLFAKIEMDGLFWYGNVEVHLKSSDWYRHKHHCDRLFDSVILHVVLEHDVDVLIGNTSVPTIELKNFIDKEHLSNYRKQIYDSFVCRNMIHSIDKIYLEQMKSKAIYERLNNKIQHLTLHYYKLNSKRQMFFLLGRAFGLKVNSEAFSELTNKIDIENLLAENEINRLSILIGASGLDETKRMNMGLNPMKSYLNYRRKNKISEMSSKFWKTKGLRPQSEPLMRIFQFGIVINRIDWGASLDSYSSLDLIHYLEEILNFNPEAFDIAKNEFGFQLKPLSKTIKNLIIINCFIPFLWCKGIESSDSRLNDKAIELLELLKPESNYYINFWKELGVVPTSAYDSQALIEIYLKYCSVKKCFSCNVGAKLLNS
jgi:hypothetical protein